MSHFQMTHTIHSRLITQRSKQSETFQPWNYKHWSTKISYFILWLKSQGSSITIDSTLFLWFLELYFKLRKYISQNKLNLFIRIYVTLNTYHILFILNSQNHKSYPKKFRKLDRLFYSYSMFVLAFNRGTHRYDLYLYVNKGEYNCTRSLISFNFRTRFTQNFKIWWSI